MSKQIKISKPGVSIRGKIRQVGDVVDVCEYKLKIGAKELGVVHEPVAVRLIAEGKAEAVKASSAPAAEAPAKKS